MTRPLMLQAPLHAPPARHSGFVGFVAVMCFILLTIPLGRLQETFLGGWTVPKLMIPMLFLLMFGSRAGRISLHPHLPYFLLFVALTTPSLLSNTDQYPSILLNFVGYALLFLLVYNGLSSIRDLRRILLAYLLGLSSVSSLAALAFFTGYDLGESLDRPFVENWYGLPIFLGTEDNPGAYGTFFVSGLPIAFMFFLTVKNRLLKLGIATLGLLFLASVVLTFSRSGIIGAVLGCLLLYHYRKNRKTISLRLLAFFLLFAVLVMNFSSLFFSVMDFTSGDVSVHEANSVAANKEDSQGYRLILLEHFFPIIVDNPLFGVGYGNLSRIMEEATGLHLNAHNIFLGVAVEFGLLACFFFCTVIILSMRTVVMVISTIENRSDRLTLGCVFASFVGLLFHGMFHEIYVNMMLWLFVALGATCRRFRNIHGGGVAYLKKLESNEAG